MPNLHTNSAKEKVFKEADALLLEPICLALCVCVNPPFQDPPYENVLLSQLRTLVIFSGTAFLLCQVKLGRLPCYARSVLVPFRSAINKFIVHFNKKKKKNLESYCACSCEDLLCAK